ncbi:MAG: hypothetical protein EOS65_29420 [Mesorhizobium sp.]|uniref:lipocalin-like domain-containing protein n=1 Tax=Mesorhizobium sp. TaxID=1871066 RepID=UPI000FD47CFE|nr:hypothetical protein EN779_09510 [Mesorhizobium sp. M4B.F.Ca.ET.088.02.2.1]RWF31436.1 MAG: hypothetical protein EOS45_10655 [Mesorhizobium sp.]RWF35820.1 MAG: hypothetical protein EOS65_29420 [Mesorhizobium sp.]TIX12769.1 MAG: lipocalin-like domain-containing protein [Mesorhizobium sp.]TIX42151.1 MAG: lipocalin-like domain-containing protein [Mesorhizobium sp.]
MAQITPVKPISADLLLGSWRMTSWMTRDVATGERQPALGQDPQGIVIYTPERVIFFIVRNNRTRPERLPPSIEEKTALFDTMFAYSGSYTVEPDRVVHHGAGAVLQGRRTYADLHLAPLPKSIRRARDRSRSDLCAGEAARRVDRGAAAYLGINRSA